MKIPTDSFGSDHQLSVPPLSQSRHGDMACETLYVRKHVQRAKVADSEPAARGIEIHQILATYINHLVRTRRSTDLEAFDSLMKQAGAEAREVLEKFRDNHVFDPEKILATELHIALDQDFHPIEDSEDDAANARIRGNSRSRDAAFAHGSRDRGLEKLLPNHRRRHVPIEVLSASA